MTTLLTTKVLARRAGCTVGYVSRLRLKGWIESTATRVVSCPQGGGPREHIWSPETADAVREIKAAGLARRGIKGASKMDEKARNDLGMPALVPRERRERCWDSDPAHPMGHVCEACGRASCASREAALVPGLVGRSSLAWLEDYRVRGTGVAG